MENTEFENEIAPVEEPEIETKSEIEVEEQVPIGIARIREEWRAAGLVDAKLAAGKEQVEPVVFTEIDGGAGIGDYTVECADVSDLLALSENAVDRLVASGELDSILVAGLDGKTRRLISESSLKRFEVDSAIDPDAFRRAAKAMADKSLAQAVDDLQDEIEDMRNSHGKIIQQMKDIMLLEIRNLKEQERDLTSFVYELAGEIREALPKKKKR